MTPDVTRILKRLRWSLALALVMTALGVALVYGAQHLLQREKAAFANAEAQRREAVGRLAQARQEEQEIRAKIARFAALEEQGLLGEERRLDWVEGIRRIQQARRLYELQYEIAPQTPLEGPRGASERYEFMQSTMRLQLQLLHEGDLLGFLDELRQSVPAYVRVRSCTVERLPAAAASATLGPQLRADCQLDWITLRERPGRTT